MTSRISAPMPAVAFLGLGIMGLPMAEHLAPVVPLRVWNRTADRADALKRFPNVITSPDPVSAVSGAGIVVMMLSTGAVVDEVLFSPGEDGRCVADVLEPSSLVVVMSSIPVETAKSQAERLNHRGVRYVDAPVSGGERGAKAATLTIMAGGEIEDVEAARFVLEPMGKVTHVGPVGSGQLAKLANQVIVGITIGAVAEALLLAEAGGADVGQICVALQGGFADSTVLRQHGPRMVDRAFEPGAHVSTQLKDMKTARELAERHGLHLPILTLAESLYQSMGDRGLDLLDHSALYLELERVSRPVL